MPTGSPIAQSDSAFSAANNGLQWKQFPGSQYIISNDTSGPFYVDLSDATKITFQDAEGYILIYYANGNFDAFAGTCELEISGTWQPPTSPASEDKRTIDLTTRQAGSSLCSDIQFICNTPLGIGITGITGAVACGQISPEITLAVGGGVGFLGSLLGPSVGIPTDLAGVVSGQPIGTFLSGRYGQILCNGAAAILAYQLCHSCPPPSACGPGTAVCNNGICQDVLSDPNNCGSCGNVVSTGFQLSPYQIRFEINSS
jgi:hypothetical protein